MIDDVMMLQCTVAPRPPPPLNVECGCLVGQMSKRRTFSSSLIACVTHQNVISGNQEMEICDFFSFNAY